MKSTEPKKTNPNIRAQIFCSSTEQRDRCVLDINLVKCLARVKDPKVNSADAVIYALEYVAQMFKEDRGGEFLNFIEQRL